MIGLSFLENQRQSDCVEQLATLQWPFSRLLTQNLGSEHNFPILRSDFLVVNSLDATRQILPSFTQSGG